MARGRKGSSDPVRQQRMVAMYRGGQTLEQIGAQFSLTRERVRQIIAKAGITRTDGGIARRTKMNRALKRAAALARRNARYLAKFGDTADVVLLLNGGPVAKGSLAMAYFEQTRNAAVRGIEWQFTFSQWVAVWHESGHLGERGREVGRYVMARHGDTGPYSADNVYITTLDDNVRDYQRELKVRGVLCPDGFRRLPENAHRRSTSSRPPARGWTYLPRANKSRPYQANANGRYLGYFATQAEAEAAIAQARGETPLAASA